VKRTEKDKLLNYIDELNKADRLLQKENIH